MRPNGTKKAYWIAGCALLLAALAVSMRLGSAEMSFDEFLLGLFRRKGHESASFIIWTLRFPRALASVVAGVGLSVSGLALQNVTGNDLAGPNIIGVNAGAGFFVILGMYFAPQMYALSPYLAFLGALTASAVIMAIGGAVRYQKATVILAGVAVTALLNAGISLIARIDTDVLSKYNDFSVGGFSSVRISRLYAPSVLIFISFLSIFFISKDIDAMMLGDDVARGVGVAIRKTRAIALICASASAGAVVSFAGLLGFVGLVVPHMARRIFGFRTRRALVGSALIGSVIVSFADTAGRILFKGTEIPVGIVMALIGVPFFVYLIVRRKRA